jgi:hypothetical protein
MKHVILISICIILQSMSVYAQSLVLPERIWSNTNYAVVPGANYVSNWITFEGDTLIEDILYMKVYRSDNEFQDNWYPFGAIHEDASDKVYLHRDDTKYLLYDFNLEKGDSILTHPGIYVYVTDVYNIYLDNFVDSLKRIDISFVKEGGVVEAYWIEGVGSSHGILEGARNVGLIGAGWAMVCFSESDYLMYKSDRFNECFPKGYLHNNERVHVQSQNIKVSISSNFVTFNFSEFTHKKATLSIIDISGRLIWEEGTTGTNQISIPRSLFNSGIFIYSFREWDKLICGKFAL